MGTATLERIEEATADPFARLTPEMMSVLAELLARLLGIAPWMGNLPPVHAVQMTAEITAASQAARRTGDRTALEELLADWEATAEAYRDTRFQEAIARPDRKFVPWTD